ncbi:pyrimidine utilization protein D [Acinetobacter sp. ANC 3813]|uniref:pyrimidine utilization protein D n=1 Tax=Acinetobacter sp. ANC 3813 TaxID=1977873 RepID=UPI000A33C00C|nr:pyrimidine utilization protein D [Acinetobacter sp. ANC 3813]OTG91011.1 pyrimidine utilization protein D [Acinetobacter sp. ANC 3813]
MHYQIHPCTDNAQAEHLILSSGLGGHGEFWKPQLEALQQHFHVLTYDHEGCHADAEALPADYSMQHMAQQVLNILKDIGIQKFHFIGHALGGHIGIELGRLISAAQEPIEFGRLSCINAWNQLDGHTHKCFQARISLLKHSGAEAYVRAQALFLYPPQWISEHQESLEQAENAQLTNFPLSHNVLMRLQALQQFSVNDQHAEALKNTQIQLIANQDDFLVPVKKSADLQKSLGQGELEIFASGAHASTQTETAQINEALLKFLLS